MFSGGITKPNPNAPDPASAAGMPDFLKNLPGAAGGNQTEDAARARNEADLAEQRNYNDREAVRAKRERTDEIAAQWRQSQNSAQQRFGELGLEQQQVATSKYKTGLAKKDADFSIEQSIDNLVLDFRNNTQKVYAFLCGLFTYLGLPGEAMSKMRLSPLEEPSRQYSPASEAEIMSARAGTLRQRGDEAQVAAETQQTQTDTANADNNFRTESARAQANLTEAQKKEVESAQKRADARKEEERAEAAKKS